MTTRGGILPRNCRSTELLSRGNNFAQEENRFCFCCFFLSSFYGRTIQDAVVALYVHITALVGSEYVALASCTGFLYTFWTRFFAYRWWAHKYQIWSTLEEDDGLSLQAPAISCWASKEQQRPQPPSASQNTRVRVRVCVLKLSYPATPPHWQKQSSTRSSRAGGLSSAAEVLSSSIYLPLCLWLPWDCSTRQNESSSCSWREVLTGQFSRWWRFHFICLCLRWQWITITSWALE